VLTALRMALTHDPARGPFGAVPAGVRIDRGLEFAAQAVKDAPAALCLDPNRLPGYTPHRKGKVERLHLTIEQTLLCGLPGYTKGPRDAAGRLHGPRSDAARDRDAAEHAAVGPMRLERFVAERFVPSVAWYNTERPHSMLDGLTPLQAWLADDTVLHRVDDAVAVPQHLRRAKALGVQRGREPSHRGVVTPGCLRPQSRDRIVDHHAPPPGVGRSWISFSSGSAYPRNPSVPCPSGP
jgi:hypothetical protein